MSKPWELSTSSCQSVESEYPCPIDGCSTHNSNKPIKWTHTNCGGYFRIYENGKEKCQKCGSECLFCNQIYNCGSKFSYYKIRAILQYRAGLVGLNDDNVSILFWLHLGASISNQQKEYPSKFV